MQANLHTFLTHMKWQKQANKQPFSRSIYTAFSKFMYIYIFGYFVVFVINNFHFSYFNIHYLLFYVQLYVVATNINNWKG